MLHTLHSSASTQHSSLVEIELDSLDLFLESFTVHIFHSFEHKLLLQTGICFVFRITLSYIYAQTQTHTHTHTHGNET